MTGLSKTALIAAARALDPSITARIGPGDIQAAVAQVGDQAGDQGLVLRRALGQRQRVLGPVDADAQRDHAAVLAEVDAVDQERDQVQVIEAAAEQPGSAVSVAATNRRETADLEVEAGRAPMAVPTGSSPAG